MTDNTELRGGQVERDLLKLAVQIDPCLIGGPDAELLIRAAATITSLREWQPISTAKKDGELLLLLIGADDDREHPLEDTAEGSRTIGFNNFENDGEDKWLFAGWCWSHDHFNEGEGKPTHWLPLPAVLSTRKDQP